LKTSTLGRSWDPLDPAAVVRNVVDRYQRVAADRGVDISWWSEPQEFGLVYGDPSSLDHVVTNLVDNAVKYATQHVEVRLTRNPTHYYVRVWDDGAGISESHRPHIFDRGWTPELASRQEKSSSGLGLFISRTLARRAGGEVIVSSSTGKGEDEAGESRHFTVMTVMLPLEESQPAQR
jgi:two-component system, OmpR family, phosphate regulon sensor histidine kinase PhoR